MTLLNKLDPSFIIRLMLISCGLILLNSSLWAAQDAIVIVDRAIIYADMELLSPIGYLSSGKVIRVGEVPRHYAQAYPVVVSGKVAYIRVQDVSTEKERLDAKGLVGERFQKSAQKTHGNVYGLMIFNYSAQARMKDENDRLKDKSSVDWKGISLSGQRVISSRWDLEVLINAMKMEYAFESFNVAELGLGGRFRVVDGDRFKLKIFAHMLATPYAEYKLKGEFSANGYGYGAGTGLGLSYFLGKGWGLKAEGGFFYTKLDSFNIPSGYKEISPSFLGTRLGLGVIYQM